MIVTLLSDLGTTDATVAACKAQLLDRVPRARLVDISHRVPHHEVSRAAYLLGSAFRSFPVGSLHIVAVGALAGKGPHRLIYLQSQGHHFIAPDSGILPALFPGDGDQQVLLCREYERTPAFMQWISDAASICWLLADGGELDYPSYIPSTHPDLLVAQRNAIGIACKPLCSDRYENIVLNLREEKFTEMVTGKSFSIRTFRGGNITEVSRHYNDVERGKPLCRFNSSGYLEIAVNHGSALELFGIAPTDPSALAYHTVRISLQ